jgi:hypothetical protein
MLVPLTRSPTVTRKPFVNTACDAVRHISAAGMFSPSASRFTRTGREWPLQLRPGPVRANVKLLMSRIGARPAKRATTKSRDDKVSIGR